VIGQTLSHYRITAALGAGGMGEVYRATDTNLHRDVAIKVLPPEVAQDPERLGRFRREAHLLAALNHPNIAAIYGLEEHGGQPFLALELVEGEDLKERLARGAIPVEDVLEIAEQIAEALEEAHNRGIVHRDLKPANVKLTPDGKVKVLDFGLAKAWAGDAADGGSSSSALSQSPTLAHTGTVAGVILGTAAYMSPEQARGKPVDKRADVWSFAVLLWEMLTGRTLFAGDTVTDVIAAVVRAEPDLSALPKDTPRAVRKLLTRCLRKDPRTRLPDIGAARLELQEIRSGAGAEDAAPTAAAEGASPAERGRRARERWAWAAVALVASGVAVAFAFVHLTTTERPRLAARFEIDAPEGWSLGTDFGWPAPSPDGRQVAFRALPTGREAGTEAPLLWVRSLDTLEARPLAGTEEGSQPFWSPDGRYLAFITADEVRRLSLADGTVQRICTLPRPGTGGGDWNEDGTILFSAGGGNGGQVFSVAATGGDAKPLTTLDESRGEQNHHVPQFLPDGRRFLFLVASTQTENAGLYVASLDAPNDKQRVASGWLRREYMAGHLLFVRDGALLAQPFDADRATLGGEPVAIAPSVLAWSSNAGLGWFGASPGGTLAFFSGATVSGQVQLTWVDRKGQRIETVGAPGDYGQIALSPDERNVALELRSDADGWDIWVMDVARGAASRVTATPGDERNPVWSPDGRSLLFSATRDGKTDLRRKGLRTGDPETVIVDTDDLDLPEMSSRDGRTLLFIRQAADDYTRQSIWTLSLEEGKEPEPLLTPGFSIDEPQISPDGRWLAYNSTESGRSEVYVEPYRREGERVRVSIDGGGQPKWRGDGRELFFTSLDSHLMSVAFRSRDDRAEVDLPTPLFEIGGFEGPDYDDYAPSANGERFLVKQPIGEGRKPRLQIITNWTSLLGSP